VTSQAHLELKLLGGFEARLRAGPAIVLPTKKTLALLAYLALPLGQAHPREKLATLLWGDMQHAQARGNLRNALNQKYEEIYGYPSLPLNFVAGIKWRIGRQ